MARRECPGVCGKRARLDRAKPHFSAEAVLQSFSGERYDTIFTVSYPPELHDSARFLVGIIDITQAKRARAAEERSERRYRSFFNFMPIALFHTEKGRAVLEVFRQARAQGVPPVSPAICLIIRNSSAS